MKIVHIIQKSFLEQWRSYWIWILTITLAPFFVLIYSLITSSYAPKLDVLIINQDKGAVVGNIYYSLGNDFIQSLNRKQDSLQKKMLYVKTATGLADARKRLTNREADLIMIIPQDFSTRLIERKGNSHNKVLVEFEGDITNTEYILSAIWSHEFITQFIFKKLDFQYPIDFNETSIGNTAQRSDFELAIPGLMVFAIIMLMFSASIAIVNETEKGTIIRIRMSPVSSAELLTGISVVQVILGLISAFLTLAVAAAMGFHMQGSFLLIFLISTLTSISIIAFSLILAAFSKSANHILVAGNFPFFIFMFLSGAMFPLNTGSLFTIGGYSIAINSILSPVHAISALNKVVFFQMGITDILPEIFSLILLSIIYFSLGVWAFGYRHLKNK